VKSIQPVLIALCLLGAILGSIVFRSKLAYRLLAAFLFFSASVCVIFPGITSEVANALGVGRGADLLLYLGLLAGIHSFLLLYLKERRMDRRITELTRAIAIRDARFLATEPQLASLSLQTTSNDKSLALSATAGRQ
jgi:small membrane protein